MLLAAVHRSTRMTRYLTSKGHRVVGSDISLAMMKIRVELSDGRSVLLRGDGEALPFADDSFDVAVCLRLAIWWIFYGLLLRRQLPRYFVPTGDLSNEFAKAGLRLVRSHTLLRGVFMERA